MPRLPPQTITRLPLKSKVMPVAPPMAVMGGVTVLAFAAGCNNG